MVAGDNAWRGVDLRTHPAELGDGMLAGATNLRLVNGRAKPRGGVRFTAPPAPGAAGLRYKGPFRHAAVYRPTDSHDRIALVCPGQIVLFNTLTGVAETSSNWAYPAGKYVTEGMEVDFIQASGDGVTTDDAYLLRGLDDTVLRFRYTNTMETLASARNGSDPWFPPGKLGVYFGGRIGVASGEQKLNVSDYLDFTAWSALQEYFVAKGGGDYLVGVRRFQQDKWIIFARKSIYLAYFASDATVGFDGQPIADNGSYLRTLTDQFGCVARRSIVEVGGSIFFLTDAGIAELNAQLDLNLLGGNEPVSAPMQPIMDRLNANGATKVCATAIRERVYFALPILGAEQTVSDVQVTSSGAYQIAVVTLAEEVDAAYLAGETVLIAGLDGSYSGLNGLHTVASASGRIVTWYTNVGVLPQVPCHGVTAQAAPTRSNVIAVLNAVNKAWESVDELPGDLRADFLLVADAGARREVWLVDQTYGPAIYESGTVDMDGTYPQTGWPTLPQTLPFTLTAPTYNGEAVQARLTTRTFNWGDPTKAKKLRQGRARFRLAANDEAVVRVVARTPADETTTASAEVLGGTTDDTVRIPLGVRCVEAHLEVDFTAGAPAVETLTAEALVDTPEQANN